MPKANHQTILVQSHPSRTEKVTEQCPQFQKNLFYYEEKKKPGQWVIFQSSGSLFTAAEEADLPAAEQPLGDKRRVAGLSNATAALSALLSSTPESGGTTLPRKGRTQGSLRAGETPASSGCCCCRANEILTQEQQNWKFHEQHIPNTISKPS